MCITTKEHSKHLGDHSSSETYLLARLRAAHAVGICHRIRYSKRPSAVPTRGGMIARRSVLGISVVSAWCRLRSAFSSTRWMRNKVFKAWISLQVRDGSVCQTESTRIPPLAFKLCCCCCERRFRVVACVCPYVDYTVASRKFRVRLLRVRVAGGFPSFFWRS